MNEPAPAPVPETVAPYGTGAQAAPQRRIRIPHLLEMKSKGEKWSMLTAYDMYTAEIFDEAGIPVLLVSATPSLETFHHASTGRYRMPMVPEVELLVRAGIPVMGHIGFTPQSEHVLGGYKVQGRGAGAEKLMDDALALEDAGCFAVVMEMVPAPVAEQVTKALRIPTIGIGAGPHCDAQVLVWQDMAGLRGGRAPRFVKKYADLRGALSQAAQEYAADVAAGTFPAPEHSFES